MLISCCDADLMLISCCDAEPQKRRYPLVPFCLSRPRQQKFIATHDHVDAGARRIVFIQQKFTATQQLPYHNHIDKS